MVANIKTQDMTEHRKRLLRRYEQDQARLEVQLGDHELAMFVWQNRALWGSYLDEVSAEMSQDGLEVE